MRQQARGPDDAAPLGGRPGRIQSVDRAIALLRAIAALPAGQASLQRVADQVGLNRSTAWRIIATLEDHGLVERRDGSYALGIAVVQFSNAISVDGFLRRAKPVIEQLAAASGETVNLAVVRRFGLYYVDQVSSRPSVAENWLGRQIPLHATSAGKAYLSALTDQEVADLLPRRLHRHTRTTLTTLEALLDDLHDCRERGYAQVVGELDPTTNGVGAPVRDAAGRPVAAVTVWGEADRVPVTRLGALGVLVLDAAEALAGRISPADDA